MFKAHTDTLKNGRIQKVVIFDGAESVTCGKTLDLWQRDERFRSFFISLLAEVPFPAYRWETPPITKATLGRVFEFVLLDSPGLAGEADPSTFSSNFAGVENNGDITAFPNLGNDAFLVVPSPRGPVSAYAHIAVFSRQAPEAQNHALWQMVGDAMAQRLGDSPIWLNTAGGGVPWLHVRLDSRPKYYGFQPYKMTDTGALSRI